LFCFFTAGDEKTSTEDEDDAKDSSCEDSIWEVDIFCRQMKMGHKFKIKLGRRSFQKTASVV
jgi:hypothetical protein